MEFVIIFFSIIHEIVLDNVIHFKSDVTFT